ncbi:hypothetical protein N9O61_01270 [Octadecabacter sp.]|nr:hypothetical protein [Octadecabacter sp.]
MVKHFAFWVGFFAAALLIVPVAIGIWGAAEEYARNLAVFLFGAISVLVALLVVLLFFRDRILQKVLGSAETTLDDVTSSLIKGVSAAARGDVPEAEQQAQAFAKSATGWYVWSGFYRWVVGSAIGLLVAFGAFAGTVLLFEQTRKLGEQTVLMGQQSELMQAQTDRMAEQAAQSQMQNEIMTISLVSELREQLEATIIETTLGELLLSSGGAPINEPLIYSSDRSCSLEYQTDTVLRSPPSEAIIQALVALGNSDQISEHVEVALSHLLADNDSAIAFGALLALDRIGRTIDDSGIKVNFHGLFLDRTELSQPQNFVLESSFVSNLTCEDCLVDVRTSYMPHAPSLSASISLSVSELVSEADSGARNIVFLRGFGQVPNNFVELVLGRGNWGAAFARAAITGKRSQHVCSALYELASLNPFVRFEGSSSEGNDLQAIPPNH